jgi:hypothetical protein
VPFITTKDPSAPSRAAEAQGACDFLQLYDIWFRPIFAFFAPPMAPLITLIPERMRRSTLKDGSPSASAISTWASGEVIGQRLVMRVRRAVTHSEQTVVTATVDGSFDKRGLPDPLVVTFYFSVRNNQLVQLIVLRNDRDT